MKKSDELKQERNVMVKAQTDLVNKAKAEDREFTPEEEQEFDKRDEDILALDKKIARAEKIEKSQKQAAQKSKAPGLITKKEEDKPFSLFRAIKTLANGNALSGKEKEVSDEAAAQNKAQGLSTGEGIRFTVPLTERAQTVSDDSGGKGGALVASVPQYVQPLLPDLEIEDLGVNVWGNLVGDVPLPTAAGFSFAYVGETEDVAATDVAISGPTLKPKRLAGVVEISHKLLIQSPSVEAEIIRLINRAYGNAIVDAALNGGGGNAPTGLYSLITTNINTTNSVPTRAIVLDLESKVDDSNGTAFNRAYLSDSKLKGIMKGTKLDTGSGLFLTDGNELNGYTYHQSTLVPTLDTGASHPLIFGDWRQLFVGYWGNLNITVDPYTKASAGKVRLIIEGYSDVALTNEKAFAINKLLKLA